MLCTSASVRKASKVGTVSRLRARATSSRVATARAASASTTRTAASACPGTRASTASEMWTSAPPAPAKTVRRHLSWILGGLVQSFLEENIFLFKMCQENCNAAKIGSLM